MEPGPKRPLGFRLRSRHNRHHWLRLTNHPGRTPGVARCIQIFGQEKFLGAGRRAHVLKCGGGTDNRATGQLVQKRMSTKMPLMLILMDYLAYCEEKDIRCQLDWRPREVNIEADQLTNENFESFSLDNGIHILWENLSFPMITLLSSFAEGFSKRKLEASGAKQVGEKAKCAKTVWG